MKLRVLVDVPEPEVAGALERFERSFVYPLGVGQTFRISHGRDYPRFFRSIGGNTAACFVATDREGEILGTLGVAIRSLRFPDGGCRLAAYLGDLRTAPGPRRGRTLLQLSAEVTAWSKAQGAVVAYGIVMDGTPRVPSEYTGRLDTYAFQELHKLCVLRLPVPDAPQSQVDVIEIEPSAVGEYYRELSASAFAPLGGFPAARSSMLPVGLLLADRSACGILEDTRQAKRLIADDGQEMITAHLSQFAYSNPGAGVRLIRQALTQCAMRKIAPALFVAVPDSDLDQFIALLGDVPGIVKAPATVYGTEFTHPRKKWHISTSEI